jgi:hypothetical protein
MREHFFRLAGVAYTSLTLFPQDVAPLNPNPLHWCVLAPLASLLLLQELPHRVCRVLSFA